MFKYILNLAVITASFFTAAAYADSENFYYITNPNPEKYDLKWESNPAYLPRSRMYKSTVLYECQRVRGHRGPAGIAGEGAWDPITITFTDKTTGKVVCANKLNEAGQYGVKQSDGTDYPFCNFDYLAGESECFGTIAGATPVNIKSDCHIVDHN